MIAGAMILLMVGACRRHAPKDVVTVQLGWYHQAQFAGFYAADQLGYYAEENIAVTLRPRPSPTVDTLASVLDGSADIGLQSGFATISARAAGQPIIAIAAIQRRFPKVFMTLATSGITRPHDFQGHTIRKLNPKGEAIVFRAMMAKLRLDPAGVREIETGYDLAPFYAGQVDIWPAFLTNEVVLARRQGHLVNIILPYDYGINSYDDVIVTTDNLLRTKPELLTRFLGATMRGWRWAIEHPQDAGELTLKYDPRLDPQQQAAMVDASMPLVHVGEDHIGWMREETWQHTYEMLRQQHLLETPLDVQTVYTMEILQRVYAPAP